MQSIEYKLSSVVNASAISMKSSDLASASARITSVMMYSTDKISRKSTESANETATLRSAAFAVLAFLQSRKFHINNIDAYYEHTFERIVPK